MRSKLVNQQHIADKRFIKTYRNYTGKQLYSLLNFAVWQTVEIFYSFLTDS